MKNIKLEFTYNGQNYYGIQKQKNKKTIQGEIENALKELFKQDLSLIIAGRTDRGVSAKKMVANFLVETKIEPKRISYALNALLPDDIRIISSEEVDINFHARHSVKQKTYKYCLYESKIKLPLFPFETQFKNELNFKLMKKAIKFFVGTKDFTSFASKSEIVDKVRTIYKTKITKTKIDGINHYSFYFTGNGFLYNQIRIMVGTLVLVGLKKIKPNDIKLIIDCKNRAKAGAVMPPEGLMLESVNYV